MPTDSKPWEAPGPGLWEMDEAHQSAPFSGYMVELFKTYFNPGVEEAGRRYGLLIQRFDMASLDGWLFMRPRIAGAPEKPGALPPRWLFQLVLRLHPELRRRTKAAQRAVESLAWRKDAEWWLNSGQEPMRRRLHALQSVELEQLDHAGLRSHIEQVHGVIADGCRVHFRNALAHWVGVGDWLVKASAWTGVPPEEALLALAGASASSLDTIDYIDRIAEAARNSQAALDVLTSEGDGEQRLRALRAASPQVAAALSDYIAEHGYRVFTGFDVADLTMVEAPENILASVAARLEPVTEQRPKQAFAQALREKVPHTKLRQYDELLETARVMYGVRDHDSGPCVHWPLGLLRRALLECGRRLVEGGLLQQPEHIFEATPREVDVTIGGAGTPVRGSELARRADAKALSARERPPARLGDDEGPAPPDEWLPPAVARVNHAFMLAMAVEYAAVEKPTQASVTTTLKGLAASRGSYEGRACVVQGPDGFIKLQRGDVLIAPFTTPAYNVVLPLLGAVVTDKGGVLSHAAIVAREYAIPAVVNTGNATTVIPDGARVRVDGQFGTVEIVDRAAAAKQRPAMVGVL